MPNEFEPVDFGKVEGKGEGSCVGGDPNQLALSAYPLLVWHDGVVKLEDGSATVVQIAEAAEVMGNPAHIAEKFATTEYHVRQAIAYSQKG